MFFHLIKKFFMRRNPTPDYKKIATEQTKAIRQYEVVAIPPKKITVQTIPDDFHITDEELLDLMARSDGAQILYHRMYGNILEMNQWNKRRIEMSKLNFYGEGSYEGLNEPPLGGDEEIHEALSPHNLDGLPATKPCPYCGKSNIKSEIFCVQCGIKVEEDE